MASHTPNLDLLKKDPITDGSQTFNIETMLNENWDKIDSAVGEVREELADMDIPLSDATNGNRSDVAASEKAVGQVMSAAQAAQTTANAANTAAAAAQARADSAFQLGNERKVEVVAALVAKGISASTSESWDSLISKMAGIIKATGNATAAQLLQGYTASNASGPITGGMINRTAEAHHQPAADTAVFPGDRVFLAPPQGYYSGSSWVTAAAPQFSPDNLPKDVNILGIIGTLERMTTAEKQAIVNAITAKGVPTSVNDSNTVLAQKIGQITTQLKQASGNASGNHSLEVNNLDFNPVVIMFGYSGNFRYSANSWDDRTASVSGDAYFIREGEFSYKSLISETNSGRDGSTTLEVTATNKWLPNGFIINVNLRTNYSATYSSRGIGRWYAFGI